jgi:hypothetical protein
MSIDQVRSSSTARPNASADTPARSEASASVSVSAGNLGAGQSSTATGGSSTITTDRGQALALSGVRAPTTDGTGLDAAESKTLVGRFNRPAMAATDLAALILLLEEVIRTLKSKDRQAQQADSDASMTTDMAAVGKMRDSAADKLSATKKSSTFQMIAGAFQMGLAGAGAFKLRAAGKSASRMGKISEESKDLTNKLKTTSGKAAKSDIRQSMRQLREENTALSNKFNQSLQSSGAYTGYGQSLSGFTSGLGARLAGDDTFKSDLATADASQMQSVSKRQSTASQMRSEEVAQLEDLRRKLLDTLAQFTASSTETNKRFINA